MPHPSVLCLPGMFGGPLSYSSQSCITCNVSWQQSLHSREKQLPKNLDLLRSAAETKERIPHDEDSFESVPGLVEHDKDANVHPSELAMSWGVIHGWMPKLPSRVLVITGPAGREPFHQPRRPDRPGERKSVIHKSRLCLLSQFSAAVFTSWFEENQDWVTNLGCIGEAPDFPLELLQQFLSFASSMGIVMQEDGIITQHARAFMSDNFTMAQ
ncbi:hypothetical protein AVEN_152630-1 [Araneus ventricosus]|uniref:Uncharacterized protein n=1 Tax=Araneus ventricosus TaxID=182803 RepID=A0A4Y2V776_ARAVE|nr:hypothetical protein AVEN_152630-1 [Araneus ventricosus]